MSKLFVLIADPQRMVAQALAVALRGYDVEALDEHPDSGADTIRAVERHRPDVVLLEYWLQDMRAPAATRAILARAPATKVIALTWLPGAPHASETLKAGACGFLTKNQSLDHLADAIRRAHAGEWPIFREELEQLVGRISQRTEISETAAARFDALAPREMEVLRLIGHGWHAAEIAKHLQLAEATVRGYIRDILAKTGTQSQIEVMALARDYGIVP